MTLLELQNDIKRTRKLLRKKRQQNSDSAEKTESYKTLELLYKKALTVANKVVNHYIDLGELDEKEKISVIFGNTPDTSKASSKELKQLQSEITKLQTENKKIKADNKTLKKQLADFHKKFTHGGRKGYNHSMAKKVKLARDNGETWRGLSKQLGISPTTAQKLYKS